MIKKSPPPPMLLEWIYEALGFWSNMNPVINEKGNIEITWRGRQYLVKIERVKNEI